MNEKNELNDIILNKGDSANSNKKIILAVATLGVILIIVVMLMNSISSSGTTNLPKAVLPPQPKESINTNPVDEPLFEEVAVVQESSSDSDLDAIAQKLKQESLQEEIKPVIMQVVKPKKKAVQKEVIKPIVKKVTPPIIKNKSGIIYYIQVGSFSKYEPNKKFLKSIIDLGFNYKYHKVTKNSKTLNKVLVGPFKTAKEARDAKIILRSKVEPGAFLIKL